MEDPGSTSSKVHPSVCSIAVDIASIIFLFRPSEKFGTHSTTQGLPVAIKLPRVIENKGRDFLFPSIIGCPLYCYHVSL